MKQMILYEDIPVEEGRLPKEMAVYRLLGALGIPFKRMDHKPVATIEACRGMDQPRRRGRRFNGTVPQGELAVWGRCKNDSQGNDHRRL